MNVLLNVLFTIELNEVIRWDTERKKCTHMSPKAVTLLSVGVEFLRCRGEENFRRLPWEDE